MTLLAAFNILGITLSSFIPDDSNDVQKALENIFAGNPIMLQYHLTTNILQDQFVRQDIFMKSSFSLTNSAQVFVVCIMISFKTNFRSSDLHLKLQI